MKKILFISMISSLSVGNGYAVSAGNHSHNGTYGAKSVAEIKQDLAISQHKHALPPLPKVAPAPKSAAKKSDASLKMPHLPAERAQSLAEISKKITPATAASKTTLTMPQLPAERAQSLAEISKKITPATAASKTTLTMPQLPVERAKSLAEIAKMVVTPLEKAEKQQKPMLTMPHLPAERAQSLAEIAQMIGYFPPPPAPKPPLKPELAMPRLSVERAELIMAIANIVGNHAPIDTHSPSLTNIARLRSQIINSGKKLIGVPYLFGGTTRSGFDCSGLVQYVYKQNGIQVPRTSRNQFAALQAVDKPQPGDLVFFRHGNRPVNHVGLYIGDNKMLHAPQSGERVKIVDIDSKYWKKRYAGARRAIDFRVKH